MKTPNKRNEFNDQDNLRKQETAPSPSAHYDEFHPTDESVKVEEEHSYSEHGPLGDDQRTDKKKKKKKDDQTVKKVAKGLSISVAGISTVLLVYLVSPSLFSASKLKASLESSIVKENSFSFVLNIDNKEEEETHTYIHNDFIKKEIQLENNDKDNQNLFSGYLDGLKPGMSYTLSVYGKNNKVYSYAFKTPYEQEPQLENIEYKCTCYLDGLFHFTMSIKDDNYHWSAFKATLTDSSLATGTCLDITHENMNQEHTIAVDEAGLTGLKATFTITATSDYPSVGHEDAQTNPYTYTIFENKEVEI